MKVQKILFPTDFSTTGDAAFQMAVSLARDAHAKLFIVHAVEPPMAYGGGELYYGLPNPSTIDLKQMLEKIVPQDTNVEYEHRLIDSDPPRGIVQFAKSEGIDLIVMGTHGRTGLSRALMGSMAEAIVRRAPCPVVTYKQPNEKKTA